MAQNYLNNGDFDGAVETYITALKLAPNNEELKEKLHSVYMLVAQSVAGERIWEKIDRGGSNRLEDVKKRAMEDRQAKIMQEEEAKARKLLEEEKKIQSELEQKETYIIKKAADELKVKLDEAERTEKLKAEEVKRIMEEQEKKKQELLESAKREAVEKWKKQKEMMQQEMPEPETGQPKAEFSRVIPDNQVQKQKSVMDYLKQAYEAPRVGEAETRPAAQPREDAIVDDIGEKEPSGKREDDIIVSETNLDSLITTAHIYISQNMLKEAMHIFNRISEKFPDHAEVKQLLQEIAKRKST
jgi:tetratricopeptide (TPR) repeat protein